MRRVLLLAMLLAVSAARAERPINRAEAFELDREATPPGRAELGFDRGAPVGDWAIALQLGLVDRPGRFYTRDVETFPVDMRETLALGLAATFGPAVLDVRIPYSHQSGARLGELRMSRDLDAWVPGDVSAGLRIA